MKPLYSLITALLITLSAFSQIKYDDGPIITSGNFVTVGTWGRNNITFSFQNGTNDIVGDDERNAVREAFRIWADYANLNFTEVANNADIVILWGAGNHGDGFPFDGMNGVLAHAFFPPPDGGAFSGDIHFDDDEQWTMDERPVPSGQPIDLVTVAAHEIGHALGLGHSNVNCALMNPFYTGSHRYLAQDDIDGIRAIYGNRSPIINTNSSCNSNTFSIRNVPTGGFVNWESSDVTITTVSCSPCQQTNLTWTGNNSGSVALIARINLPCGIVVNETFNVSNVGRPQPPSIVGLNYDRWCGTYVEAGCTHPAGATNYIWNLNYGQVTGEGDYFYQAPLVYNPMVGFTYYNYLSVQAQNACGTSDPTTVSLTVGPVPARCGSGMQLMLSPNPTTGMLTVQTTDNTEFTKLLIVDKLGQVRKQFTYAASNKATINVSDLPADIYLVRALINNTLVTASFIKQ